MNHPRVHSLMAVAIAALFATTACAPGAPVMSTTTAAAGATASATAPVARRGDLTGLVLAPIGFQALIISSEMVAAGGGNMVAAGGGNMVAAGGGNVVPTGGSNIVGNAGGNMVAAGGGNVIVNNGGTMVAAGGGNVIVNNGGTMVAAGGGNIVGNAGGNMVAAGGGNVIVNNGGNMVAAGGGNMVAAGGGNLTGANRNIVAQGGGKLLAGLVAAGGGNMVAAGGGNMVAAGGGNMVAAGGGNYQLAQGADDPPADETTYDDAQAPLVGAEVYLADTTGKPLPQFKPTLSDDSGHYTFKDVPEGLNVIVAVRIRAKGDVNGTMQTIATIKTGENQADVNLSTTMLAAMLLEDKEEGLLAEFEPAVFAETLARLEAQIEAFVEAHPDLDLAAPQELHAGIVAIIQEDPVLAQAIVEIHIELVVEPEPTPPPDQPTPQGTDAPVTGPTPAGEPAPQGTEAPVAGPTPAGEPPGEEPAFGENGAEDDDTPQQADTQIEIRTGGVNHTGVEAIRRSTTK